MMIEIRGTNTTNKGAELMLLSILQERNRVFRGSEFAVPHFAGTYSERAKLGLFQKLELVRLGRYSHLFGSVVPREMRRAFGLVNEDDLFAVIDASGYQCGDPWGRDPTIQLAHLARRLARKRKKLILLPQAFGPFSGTSMLLAMRSIAEHATIIFARDEVSYEHLRSTGACMDRVLRAPDFSCLLTSQSGPEAEKHSGDVCIIPNARMEDKLPRSEADRYLKFLVRTCELLTNEGQRIFILILGGAEDRDVAIRLQEACGNPMEIVEEPSPPMIKGILSRCRAVIGSRYHGLISALSQGVPSVGAGWGHKYNELFRHYNCPAFLLDDLSDHTRHQKTLALLLDSEESARVRVGLTAQAERDRRAAKTMWGQVAAALFQES